MNKSRHLLFYVLAEREIGERGERERGEERERERDAWQRMVLCWSA
jgi:hypothetical protein